MGALKGARVCRRFALCTLLVVVKIRLLPCIGETKRRKIYGESKLCEEVLLPRLLPVLLFPTCRHRGSTQTWLMGLEDVRSQSSRILQSRCRIVTRNLALCPLPSLSPSRLSRQGAHKVAPKQPCFPPPQKMRMKKQKFISLSLQLKSFVSICPTPCCSSHLTCALQVIKVDSKEKLVAIKLTTLPPGEEPTPKVPKEEVAEKATPPATEA